MNLNIVGNNFLHTTGGNKGYSTHGKEFPQIQWKTDWSSDYTFYIDQHIFTGMSDVISEKKFAWLLESWYIAPAINDWVADNLDQVLGEYDLLFTHREDLVDRNPDKIKWLPLCGYWVRDTFVRETKSKLVSMIASSKGITKGHRYRLQAVEKWGKDPRCDLYGRGWNEIEFKEQGLEDYMFSIAIENGDYPCILTEKLFDCFACGTVPIHWGAPKSSLVDKFNTDGIIFLDDEFDLASLTPELYESMLPAIRDNCERVKRYEMNEFFIYDELKKLGIDD